ncbi:MAG: phosphoribosyltransferase [Methanomicrobiales archaeon]|nr:phosphoribosyltransferase [Methanomicrobiales archaeon]
MTARIIEDPYLRDKCSVYKDRRDAGTVLGHLLCGVQEWSGPVCCPIPAGGVPVAAQIARILLAPLRLTIVRKVHVPWNQEAGFGAVTWDGRVILNTELLDTLGMTGEEVDQVIEETRRNIQERIARLRPTRPEPDLRQREVILIDDGLASGYTMLAAVGAVRHHEPASITVAVPTAHDMSIRRVTAGADYIVCPNIRSGPHYAVADAYREWHDVSDKEVLSCLKMASDHGLY